MPATRKLRSQHPKNLASLIRGLYGRVAHRLKVDPSYVSRVARGERRSDDVELALEQELRKVMTLVKGRSNGTSRAAGQRSSLKPKKVAKRR